jgi:hypothetical protein
MTVYVAEIHGRAVVAFNADNDLEAEREIEDEIFQNDLAVLESSGRPIWDGEAEIQIREADEDERGKFDSSRAKAILEGEIGERECWKVYLVPVSDPTNDPVYLAGESS